MKEFDCDNCEHSDLFGTSTIGHKIYRCNLDNEAFDQTTKMRLYTMDEIHFKNIIKKICKLYIENLKKL
jgi:hypothetical protein